MRVIRPPSDAHFKHFPPLLHLFSPAGGQANTSSYISCLAICFYWHFIKEDTDFSHTEVSLRSLLSDQSAAPDPSPERTPPDLFFIPTILSSISVISVILKTAR